MRTSVGEAEPADLLRGRLGDEQVLVLERSPEDGVRVWPCEVNVFSSPGPRRRGQSRRRPPRLLRPLDCRGV